MLDYQSVRCLEKVANIPQMVVTNGDESHGIESVKNLQLNKSKQRGVKIIKQVDWDTMCKYLSLGINCHILQIMMKGCPITSEMHSSWVPWHHSQQVIGCLGCDESRHLHTRKLTCPLKRDYLNREYIFQPLIFRGHVSFQGSIQIVCEACKWKGGNKKYIDL